MLARPFASEMVPARAVCRLKCSAVAIVTADASRSPRLCASSARGGANPLFVLWSLPSSGGRIQGILRLGRIASSGLPDGAITTLVGSDDGREHVRTRLGRAPASHRGQRERARVRGGGA